MRRRLLFSLVVLLLVALVAEGAARAVGGRFLPPRRSLAAMPGEPIPSEPNMIVDTVTGWRAKTGPQNSFGIPGGTVVNSRGLRGPEVPIEKPAGARRVLLVGDSTVFGVLVADGDTFAHRLETALQAVDPRVEVLNGAAPGWSSWQARRALEAGLLDYRPDLLVIATLWSDAQGHEQADSVRFSPVLPILDRSRAFLWTREWVREARYGRAVEEVRVGLGADGAPPRVPLEEYRANLAAMAADVAAVGGRPAFLVLPCVRDPTAGKVGDFRDGYRLAMRQTADQLGAPIADTPAAFVGTQPTRMFFDEVHPTPAGHAIVADVLARALDAWVRG